MNTHQLENNRTQTVQDKLESYFKDYYNHHECTTDLSQSKEELKSTRISVKTILQSNEQQYITNEQMIGFLQFQLKQAYNVREILTQDIRKLSLEYDELGDVISVLESFEEEENEG